ncbi:MAG TPA: polysaccharide biosynthesis protein [Xanthobacteraceae bacterium]|nr:polysaccharide biosynthesis protein [Xanthobacteraceae bacterium]
MAERPAHPQTQVFAGKRVLITGGTGSLGTVLLRRLLSGGAGHPEKIVVFSRDESKQHQLRLDLLQIRTATDEIVYQTAQGNLEFRIGDIRDFHAVGAALSGIDIVFNTAALKQVPTCEYFPYEAVQTNVEGAENIVRAIQAFNLPVETVVGISTDKAVSPVNVMGMTKALQERIFVNANRDLPKTRFILARYGNVLASRGSVVPLFHEQIRQGGPVTITDTSMTRFLLSLEDAVTVILSAVQEANPGEMYVPIIPSARVIDVAKVLIDNRKIKTIITGRRPGEKIHEVLVSEEERYRTIKRGRHYVIEPILPELRRDDGVRSALEREYSSADDIMPIDQVRELLVRKNLMVSDDHTLRHHELLR